jgi:lysozyme
MKMMLNKEIFMTLYEFLKLHEGFRSLSYQCPGGYATIGYGHRLRPLEKISFPLSLEEADFLLHHDVAITKQALIRLVRVPLNEGQSQALISFIFNLGPAAFQRSSLRRKINREDHDGAALEFERWIWCGPRKLPGLIKRRQLEKEMYQGDLVLVP